MNRKRSPLVNGLWLQRSTDAWLHIILCIEQQISPDYQLRRWLRQNARVGIWLFVPAVLVMPTVGIILWQIQDWMQMLISIFGHLIVLPILILLALVSIRIVTAFFKR